MVYTGNDTDIEHGKKYADKYEFLTNNSLDTLKRFGNLLVSFENFKKAIQLIAKSKFNRAFKIPIEFDNHTDTLYNSCLSELVVELTELTGFKEFGFRLLKAKTVDESDCVVIEAAAFKTPTLISDWEELSKVQPSKTHKLEIDVQSCNGWIIALNREFDYDNCHYLSTHTFYGKNHEESTKILRSCGFNVTLKNWD